MMRACQNSCCGSISADRQGTTCRKKQRTGPPSSIPRATRRGGSRLLSSHLRVLPAGTARSAAPLASLFDEEDTPMSLKVTFPGGVAVNAEYRGQIIRTDQPREHGGGGGA